MSDRTQPEFDQYAEQYTELHRSSIRASGEEPAYFARYKAHYVAANRTTRPSRTVLDVLDFGCGVGNSIPHLHAALPNAHLHGVDPSGESIRLAAARFHGLADFCTGTDTHLPYADGSFDLVQAACVFHHVAPDRRDHWLREIRRVLRPGAELFVFEHNVLNPLTRKAVRDCPFDADAILLPRHELVDRVAAAGFTSIRARYIVFFPSALKFLRRLEPLLGGLPLGAQYVVRARA